jgi:hypothetical protein
MLRWLGSNVMKTACLQAVRLEDDLAPNARQQTLQREARQDLEGLLNVS